MHGTHRFGRIGGTVLVALVAGCGRVSSEDLRPSPAGAEPTALSTPPDPAGSAGSAGSGTGVVSTTVAAPVDAVGPLTEPAGSVVLFGGAGETGSFLADTWTWNGSAWAEQAVPGPSARVGAVMASLDGQVVLFGGLSDTSADASYADDTWVWNGSTWRQVAVAGPPGRAWAVMAPLDGKLVLFGGGGNDLAPHSNLADTWTFDGSVWTKLDVSGPAKRVSAAMAPLNGELVLFGGFDADDGVVLSDTWTWDGTAWNQTPGTLPSPREGASMAAAGGALVLFGGDAVYEVPAMSLGDTWTWEPSVLTRYDVPGPPARTAAAMVTVDGQALLFGGWGNVNVNGDQNLADTWSWDGATWTPIVVAGPPRRSGAAIANLAP